MSKFLLRHFYRHSNSVDGKMQFLYGINPIQMAIAANRRKIETLFLTDSQSINPSYRITKIINKAHQNGLPILFYGKDKMNRIVRDQPHQNIIIKCSTLQPQQGRSIQTYQQGIYVFCDKITDPQNLGAILRSSLYFGIKGIFLSKKNVSPLNSTVSKASSGALELMQIFTVPREEQFVKQWSKSEGVVISTSVSSQTTKPISPQQCRQLIKENKSRYKRVLLILGSQGFGVSPHLARNSDISICVERKTQARYPYDLVDSLNVNSALSCILYELTKG